MADVWVKSVVAQSTIDHVRSESGPGVWDAIMAKLSESDRIAVSAGGNVPLKTMGAFNEAYVEIVCRGSRSQAAEQFKIMGAKSAEKLLLGNGIFSIFARLVTPKQVLNRAENVIKTAYPGAVVDVELNSTESGGVIYIHGMEGYPYGSQRLVGWLLRGIEIVGGRNARVRERNWDAGLIDSDTYEVEVSWEGWR